MHSCDSEARRLADRILEVCVQESNNVSAVMEAVTMVLGCCIAERADDAEDLEKGIEIFSEGIANFARTSFPHMPAVPAKGDGNAG